MALNHSNDSHRRWWTALWAGLTYWVWRRWTTPSSQENAADDAASQDAAIERGHEAETANVGGIVAFGVVLLAAIGVTLITLLGLYWWFAVSDGAPSARFDDVERIPPEPRLQQVPSADLQHVHRQAYQQLHTYGWADSARTAARIPIERAMAILADRGLPYDTTARTQQTYRLMSESGFAVQRPGPLPPAAPPILGGGSEPYVPSPQALRELAQPMSQYPNWELRTNDPE
jgi:hypothetical protein